MEIKNKDGVTLVTIQEANLSEADLSKANLSRADLSRADLSGANLSGATLYGANLYEADLYEANLSEADLSKANLYEANLYRADLSKANLYEANLYRVNLPLTDRVLISRWSICHIQREFIRIGCEYHTTAEWENFSDAEIKQMDPLALDWWRANKTIILAIAAECEPYEK